MQKKVPLFVLIGLTSLMSANVSSVVEADYQAKRLKPPPENPWVPMKSSGDPKCVDQLFIGFRGSGEQPRGFEETGVQKRSAAQWSTKDFKITPVVNSRGKLIQSAAAKDHLGQTLWNLYEAFRVRAKERSESIGFYSVGVSDFGALRDGQMTYSAMKVSLKPSYLAAISSDSLNSAWAGSVNLRNFARRCVTTQFVVAGYSQGSVMARSFVRTMSGLEEFQNRIAALVLIADPLFRPIDAKRFGLGFDADHQMGGLLTEESLASAVEGCESTKVAFCAVLELLSRSIKIALNSFLIEYNSWRLTANGLDSTTAGDFLPVVRRIGVICDSGDGVCSPVRYRLKLGFRASIVESDIIDRNPSVFDRHVKYKSKSLERWWIPIVDRLMSN